MKKTTTIATNLLGQGVMFDRWPRDYTEQDQADQSLAARVVASGELVEMMPVDFGTVRAVYLNEEREVMLTVELDSGELRAMNATWATTATRAQFADVRRTRAVQRSTAVRKAKAAQA